MIDRKKLKEAIAADTKDIRKWKSEGYHGGILSAAKLQATKHHALAAHLNGHIHLSGKFLCQPRWIGEKWGPFYWKPGMTTEEQAKFISEEMEKFVVKELEPAMQQTA
jgi:hypothetical protein